MKESSMIVKVYGRGSKDLIKDMKLEKEIPSYSETNQIIPQNRQSDIKPKQNVVSSEYGYTDDAYVRFMFENVKNKKITAEYGATFIVLRIFKILGIASCLSPEYVVSNKILDSCLTKLIDIYANQFENTIENNSFDNEYLTMADVIIREICDILSVKDTTRIQKFQKLVEDLF